MDLLKPEEYWDEPGDWFIVTMYDYYTGIKVEQDWPVYAKDFDSAMTIYTVLLKWSMREGDYY